MSPGGSFSRPVYPRNHGSTGMASCARSKKIIAYNRVNVKNLAPLLRSHCCFSPPSVSLATNEFLAGHTNRFVSCPP